MAATLLMGTPASLPCPTQVHPHLSVCIKGEAWAGLDLELGSLFPHLVALSATLSTQRGSSPHCPPHDYHPPQCLVSCGAGLGPGAAGPSSVPTPLLIPWGCVTSEIWQFPIWVPDESWLGGGKGLGEGTGREAFWVQPGF